MRECYCGQCQVLAKELKDKKQDLAGAVELLNYKHEDLAERCQSAEKLLEESEQELWHCRRLLEESYKHLEHINQDRNDPAILHILTLIEKALEKKA